jgi:hypothetical protein
MALYLEAIFIWDSRNRNWFEVTLWSGESGVLANRKGVMLGEGVSVTVGVKEGVWVDVGLGV